MGTLLYARGVPYDQCFEALNLERPDVIRGVHDAYISAGAQVIETNTFGANADRLGPSGHEDRVREINLAGARIAREAAGIREVFVAGSIGPVSHEARRPGGLTDDELRAIFAEQAQALIEGGGRLPAARDVHRPAHPAPRIPGGARERRGQAGAGADGVPGAVGHLLRRRAVLLPDRTLARRRGRRRRELRPRPQTDSRDHPGVRAHHQPAALRVFQRRLARPRQRSLHVPQAPAVPRRHGAQAGRERGEPGRRLLRHDARGHRLHGGEPARRRAQVAPPEVPPRLPAKRSRMHGRFCPSGSSTRATRRLRSSPSSIRRAGSTTKRYCSARSAWRRSAST